jgi:hypothetical protein
MGLRGIVKEDVVWMQVIQDRDRGQAVVNI